MTTRPRSSKARPAILRGAGFFVALLSLTSCTSPDLHRVANRLRETNIKQEKEIGSLKEQLANRDATISALREKAAASSIPTLPSDRLAQLFTVSRIELRSISDISDISDDATPPKAFRVFVRMFTADNQPLPASGTLTIEAFELLPSPVEPRRVGAWTFTPEQMKKSWYAGMGLNHFAFDCPWTGPPTTSDITFKARFTDLLTGNTLVTQLHKNVRLPAPK